MKTTVEIRDGLLLRAKRRARERRTTLRAVLEESLRRTLDETEPRQAYRWPDLSVGGPTDPWPLDKLSWPELRGIIYGDRDEA